MFPQLIAGPIVNYSEVSEALKARKTRFPEVEWGVTLFIMGLTYKVLLANKISSLWNEVQTVGVYGIDAPTAWLGSWGFSMQIYFDFFGYSLMAIGLGRIMGFKIPGNFANPYTVKSATTFWRRWHMTLTGFLRKYIYFPLGGSRMGKIRTYINIMIIFLISGIWHGANYTFIIWGLIHGMLNCFDRLIKKLMPEKQNTLVKCIRVVLTFTAVNFLWLLFRCGSLSQAAMLFGRLFEGRTEGMTAVISSGFNIPEFRIVESFVPFAASMVTKMPALPAYIFLGAAAAVVFVCRNSHETEFKPDVKTALFTIAALFWSVMSFTGISSFIYAGF
jgi:alginate O-acetyltransferase complex protein AlgI